MNHSTLERSILKAIPKNHIGAAEVQWIRTLKHPHLPQIRGIFEGESTPTHGSQALLYIQYNFVDGIDLETYIKEHGPLNEAQLRKIALRIIDILSFFHAQKPPIVFRDLKPSNLILKTGTHDEIVLIDFVTIRSLKENQDVQAQTPGQSDTVVLGTVGFAAPEAYGFFQTDQRSDIFSFGATLFYLATGQLIQGTHNSRGKSTKIQLDPELMDVIGKCTSFSPDLRYQSLSELSERLAIKHHQTIEYEKSIDPFAPTFDLQRRYISQCEWETEASINLDAVSALWIETTDGLKPLSFRYVPYGKSQWQLTIDNPIAPVNILPINTELRIQMALPNHHFIHVNFRTHGLPKLQLDGTKQRLFIPANPEAGFNYPYYLVLPPGLTKPEQIASHLIVTPPVAHYNGNSNLHQALETGLEAETANTISNICEDTPCVRLLPALPRYRIRVDHKWSYSTFFDSTVLSLTPDSRLENLDLEHPITPTQIKASIRLDLQLKAMLVHACQYLCEQGITMSHRHVFLGGGSPGHFAYRFSILHPECVQAIVALAINGHVTLPTDTFRNTYLPFPVGLGDLEQWGVIPITRDKQALNCFKTLPKLLFMHKIDNNDVLHEIQCYTKEQRASIIEALGEKMCPERWENTQDALEALQVRALCLTSDIVHRGFTLEQINFFSQFIKGAIKAPSTIEALAKDELSLTTFRVIEGVSI